MPFFALLAGFVVGLITNFQLPLPQQEPLADRASLAALSRNEAVFAPLPDNTADFHGAPASPPDPKNDTADIVLGATTRFNDKHIEVDLSKQRVYAYEGNRKVYEFVISSGLWGRTPTGVFTIWAKVRSQLMQGGNKDLGTYYYLPNVPYVMFFYNTDVAKMRGFSFHGTYWHENFGHPMSHGCINMRTDEAKILYEWATPVVTNPNAWSTNASDSNPGTTVIIYGEAPGN